MGLEYAIDTQGNAFICKEDLCYKLSMNAKNRVGVIVHSVAGSKPDDIHVARGSFELGHILRNFIVLDIVVDTNDSYAGLLRGIVKRKDIESNPSGLSGGYEHIITVVQDERQKVFFFLVCDCEVMTRDELIEELL